MSNIKAVIYCRVSSPTQLREGDGLGSQETRCREFAKHKGYAVTKVFQDKGVSGGLINRPGMQDMLSFLQDNKKEAYVVLIDDISRLARGLEAHIQLRTEISSVGAKLESPSIEFGEDSDSQLVENLLASVSQHQRQKNAEQTKNRMMARVMNGYWSFFPPPGYRFEKNVPGHSGKLLVRDEPMASIIQEAFEGYASGRFETYGEVKRFLESCPAYPKDKKGEVHFERVPEIFSRVIYAGYIDIPKWGVSFQPAKHEPLISFETWQQAQNRKKEQSKAPARKDLNEDFPLRGFVTCGTCEKPLTSCWSKGRNKKYPYYHCNTKGCPDYKKSVRKEKIEEEFETLLAKLRPSQNLFYLALEMFRDLWEERLEKSKMHGQSLNAEISRIERKIQTFMSRIVKTEDEELIFSV